MPFFTCRNIFFDKDIQKDIQKYVYCTDLGVSPHKGDFGEQPAMWIDKYFIIKKTFAKLEKSQISEARQKNKGKNG